MRRELSQLRGSNAIQVINSGRVGETIQGNVARFERDVFSYRPDLVVWQLGTNDVVFGGRLDPQLRGMVLEGVRKLKASGADVILMDLQYTVRVLASDDYSEMEAILEEVARLESVGLFSRFALMRKSIEAGVSPDALVSWDGLHNTAEGYDCIGRALGRLIWSSVRRR
jgi:lysophospholipase L1-like esterase